MLPSCTCYSVGSREDLSWGLQAGRRPKYKGLPGGRSFSGLSSVTCRQGPGPGAQRHLPLCWLPLGENLGLSPVPRGPASVGVEGHCGLCRSWDFWEVLSEGPSLLVVSHHLSFEKRLLPDPQATKPRVS